MVSCHKKDFWHKVKLLYAIKRIFWHKVKWFHAKKKFFWHEVKLIRHKNMCGRQKVKLFCAIKNAAAIKAMLICKKMAS